MGTKNRGNIQVGILFIQMAAFGFGMMSFFVKLAGDVPVMQKAFFRNAIAAIVAIVLLAKSKEKPHIGKENAADMLLRCIFGTLGLVCNFWAISHMRMADANMLGKISPFIAVIMSYLILAEKPSKTDLLCVFVALCGEMFIIKPGAGIVNFPALIGLLGGAAAGTAYTYVRKLGSNGVKGPIIVCSFSLFSCIITVPFIVFDYYPMTSRQLVYLLLAGLFAALGQLSVTTAYSYAPAKVISVFDYTQVLYAALLGFFFFGEIPDGYSLIGYGIVIGVAVFKWSSSLKKGKEAS